MRQKPNIILGISPGTRSMGYAIMADGELVDWGVKSFKGKWSDNRPGKILEIIHRLIIDYKVKRIAIKTSRDSHCSAHLTQVYSSIKRYVKNNQLESKIYSKKELMEGSGKVRNNKELFKFIRKRFPELGDLSLRNSSLDNIKQFEAIGIGILSDHP